MDITFNDIINHLGQPRTKIGGEYIWQCPICMDNHKDNLHYNEKKNILWCFANSEHNKIILSEIMKKKYEERKKEQMEAQQIPAYIKNKEQYLYYQVLCNDALLGTLDKSWLDEMNEKDMFENGEYDFYINLIKTDKPQKAREYLKAQIGINKDTIKVTGLGLDFFANKWVFPIFDMSANLVGFEYRYKDLKQKKIWRRNGTPKVMAQVYGCGRNLYICEGYKDCYAMIEIFKHYNKLDNVKIVTSANGVSHTLDVISQLKFSDYDSINLCLDNDKIKEKIIKNGRPQDVSRQMTKAIIEKYPFIKDKTPPFTDEELEQGYKDVADWLKLKVR